jgi:uncharacterized membrane protein
MEEKRIQQRFWEIDFLRGMAIVIMVVYHLIYNLNYFGQYDINLDSIFWLYVASVTRPVFIFLVGVSLALSFSRARKISMSKKIYS